MSSKSGEHLPSWFEFAVGGVHNSLVHLLESNGAEHGYAMLGANAVMGSWLVCLGLIFVALIARKQLNSAIAKQGVARYHSESGFSFRNLIEVYTCFIHDLAERSLGRKDTRNFFWLLGGMFLYIMLSNLIGILPGGIPPSQSISNNLAMALVVLVVFVCVGFSRQGVVGYFKHMAGEVWWLMPLIFVIEFFGVFIVRPGSLSLRLTGNLNGDHIVLGIASDLVPLVFPVLALCLGIFVSVVQAFVFTLLTIVYIDMSIPHGEEH